MLKNKYWILRHGRSVPNERGLIVSDKRNGVFPEHGLAEEGLSQAKAAGQRFLEEVKECGLSNISIYSSPFSRTIETAKCVAEVLGSVYESIGIQILDELRERYFGPLLELQSHLHYSEIWELDSRNPLIGPEGGESVSDVADRVVKVIPVIECEVEGHAVLIVSHGDTLQILQAVEAKWNHLERIAILSQHRTFSLNTGELRRLA